VPESPRPHYALFMETYLLFRRKIEYQSLPAPQSLETYQLRLQAFAEPSVTDVPV
jgi:hypothetical protein